MATMNISLPAQLKDFVEERVAEGRYSNSSDFVRDLIRRDQERLLAIAEIQQALDEGDASGYVPFVRTDMERRLDALTQKREKSKPARKSRAKKNAA